MLFSFRPVMHESGKNPCDGLSLYYIGEFMPAKDDKLSTYNFIYINGGYLYKGKKIICSECGQEMTEVLPQDIKELQ